MEDNTHRDVVLDIIEEIFKNGFPKDTKDITKTIYARHFPTVSVPSNMRKNVSMLFRILRAKDKPAVWMTKNPGLMEKVKAIRADYCSKLDPSRLPEEMESKPVKSSAQSQNEVKEEPKGEEVKEAVPEAGGSVATRLAVYRERKEISDFYHDQMHNMRQDYEERLSHADRDNVALKRKNSFLTGRNDELEKRISFLEETLDAAQLQLTPKTVPRKAGNSQAPPSAKASATPKKRKRTSNGGQQKKAKTEEEAVLQSPPNSLMCFEIKREVLSP